MRRYRPANVPSDPTYLGALTIIVGCIVVVRPPSVTRLPCEYALRVRLCAPVNGPTIIKTNGALACQGLQQPSLGPRRAIWGHHHRSTPAQKHGRATLTTWPATNEVSATIWTCRRTIDGFLPTAGVRKWHVRARACTAGRPRGCDAAYQPQRPHLTPAPQGGTQGWTPGRLS